MLTTIRPLSRLAHSLSAKLGWLGPLLVRILVGLSFAVGGWGKLHNLDGITKYFTSLGIPAPGANAAFVSIVEFLGGLLLIVGLGTRIAALFLIGVMAVAFLTAILPESQSFLGLFSTIELTYLVIFVWLAVSGAGPISIDRLLTGRRPSDPQVGEAA